MLRVVLATAAVLTVAVPAACANPGDAYDEGSTGDQGNQGPIQPDPADASAPAPGSITVRLNGRVRAYFGSFNDTDGNRPYFYNPATGAASNRPFAVGGFDPVTGAPTVSPAARIANKNADTGVSSYVRLYPGFDGVAANGLRYGASVEILTDAGPASGVGLYGPNAPLDRYAQERQRGVVYIRRASGYVGTETAGTLKVGATDGPSSLFMVGNFENFNDGGWNGDVFSQLDPNVAPAWPFADVGTVFSTNKAIYLSPQFEGFDFGVAWEPNTSGTGTFASGSCNGNAGYGGLGAGCDRLSSTSTGQYALRRNTADLAVRYRGIVDDVGFAAFGNYIAGGSVSETGPLTGAYGQRPLRYDGLSVVVGGAAFTYAGFSVGGMAQTGQYNGANLNIKARGQKDASAWLAGGSYTIGPVIVGASYFDADSAGVSGLAPSGAPAPLVGQRRERGVAAGGTYTVASGLNLFLSYLWGDRKENGYDFITGETNTAANPAAAAHSNVKASLLTLGTSFTW